MNCRIKDRGMFTAVPGDIDKPYQLVAVISTYETQAPFQERAPLRLTRLSPSAGHEIGQRLLSWNLVTDIT